MVNIYLTFSLIILLSFPLSVLIIGILKDKRQKYALYLWLYLLLIWAIFGIAFCVTFFIKGMIF
jgi:hypothetical protein